MKFYANKGISAWKIMDNTSGIKIAKKKLEQLFKDNIKSATAVDLVYVSDHQEGITRIYKSGLPVYLLKGIVVEDEKTLMRIKSLVLPPAWQQVWICTNPNGHLQATGIDAKGRKQYKYHPLWSQLRGQAKFHHLYEFGKALPLIRQRIQADLAKPGLHLEKVLAAVVSVMEHTAIRVGNSMYEKLYGSFGLTTLKNRHVTIKGTQVSFNFIGKKGVRQNISLHSRRLSRIVQQCRDIPGRELFQYIDSEGGHHAIDSGMVNSYIKEISGGSFTAKDFRTWTGTLHAVAALKMADVTYSLAGINKNIVAALDNVAQHLGNTRTVCKKYYVHPYVLELYSNGILEKFTSKNTEDNSCLSAEEQILMNILEKSGPVIID